MKTPEQKQIEAYVETIAELNREVERLRNTEKIITVTAPYWIAVSEEEHSLRMILCNRFPNHKIMISTIGSEDSKITLHFHGGDKDPVMLDIPVLTKIEKVNRFDSVAFYLGLFLLLMIFFFFYKIITL